MHTSSLNASWITFACYFKWVWTYRLTKVSDTPFFGHHREESKRFTRRWLPFHNFTEHFRPHFITDSHSRRHLVLLKILLHNLQTIHTGPLCNYRVMPHCPPILGSWWLYGGLTKDSAAIVGNLITSGCIVKLWAKSPVIYHLFKGIGLPGLSHYRGHWHSN